MELEQLWFLLRCSSGGQGAAHLHAVEWSAVAVVSAAALFIFVRYMLNSARPVTRGRLHGVVVLGSVIALIVMTALWHFFHEGYVSFPYRAFRRAGKISVCANSGLYWTFMTVVYLAWLGLVAMIMSYVIRLRRPYRRYDDPVE